MWIYQQSDGWLIAPAGERVAQGYSGSGAGKNNHALENVKDVGPIPCGTYLVERPTDTVTHGPYVLPLRPFATNEMHGRSGFLIHGDSVVEPGTASNGCIIMPHAARVAVWESGERGLQVVPGPLEPIDIRDVTT